jgi:HPt (histidine-containing phosphotransfer) domain-containing protein
MPEKESWDQPGSRWAREVPTWADALEGLRAEYLGDSDAKLEAIALLIQELVASGGADGLEELERRFHGLKGSGSTYGFPRVSSLGARGEQACRIAVKRGGTVSAGDLAECRAVLKSLRREFAPSPLRSAEALGASAPL